MRGGKGRGGEGGEREGRGKGPSPPQKKKSWRRHCSIAGTEAQTCVITVSSKMPPPPRRAFYQQICSGNYCMSELIPATTKSEIQYSLRVHCKVIARPFHQKIYLSHCVQNCKWPQNRSACVSIRFVLLTIVEHYHVVQCSADSQLVVTNHGWGVIFTAAISSRALSRIFRRAGEKITGPETFNSGGEVLTSLFFLPPLRILLGARQLCDTVTHAAPDINI